MKMLVLDEGFPYPLNNGKRIRTFNLYKRLAGRHQIHYLAYGENDSQGVQKIDSEGMHAIAVEKHLAPKSGIYFYFRLFMNLWSKYPYIVSNHYSRLFQVELDRAIEQVRPDLLICEWTPYAVFLDAGINIPKVIVAHNIEGLIWKRYYENENNIIKKLYIELQMRKVSRFEREVFNKVDGVTAVSEKEAVEIRRINPGLNVGIVENGVDLDYYTPAERASQANLLVFVGAMDWRPNQDAVHYFVEEIFPLIRAKAPDTEVVMVGLNPPDHILRLGRVPGVTIAGRVDDVRESVRKSAVSIVPLRIGGGTRLKILEALSMEKVVVSTVVGAEGLSVKDGENILLAESSKEFAQKALLALSDPELRSRLGKNGRRLVTEKYGWDLLAAKYEKFLMEIADSR